MPPLQSVDWAKGTSSYPVSHVRLNHRHTPTHFRNSPLSKC